MDVLAATNIKIIVKKKSDTQAKPLQKSTFFRSLHSIVKEIVTEQVQQMLSVSFALQTYGNKDKPVQQFFFGLFHSEHDPSNFSLTLSTGSQY